MCRDYIIFFCFLKKKWGMVALQCFVSFCYIVKCEKSRFFLSDIKVKAKAVLFFDLYQFAQF